MLLPRGTAGAVMSRPFEQYRMCGKDGDALHVLNHSADCCGGGPTSQMMGEILRARVPLVGPAYVGSKWGSHPNGSAEARMVWHTLVVRTEASQADDDWYESQFIIGKGKQPYFPDSATCRRITGVQSDRPLTFRERLNLGNDAAFDGSA